MRNGRAYERVEFRNRDIAFKLAAQEERTPGFGLVIDIYSVSKMMVDLGSIGYPYPDYGNLPVTMVYNELYNQILVVDMGLRGLVPITLEGGFPDGTTRGIVEHYQ